MTTNHLSAKLISSNADEATAQFLQHPVLVRYAKLETKSQEKPGTRIKVRAGMYLYTAGQDTYEISEEQNFDGTFTGNWIISLDSERQHIATIKTLKDATATIDYWAGNG